MSRENITRCDVDGCGLVKGAGNHWWQVIRHNLSLSVLPHGVEPHQGFAVKARFDACGADHMLKILAREAAALLDGARHREMVDG